MALFARTSMNTLLFCNNNYLFRLSCSVNNVKGFKKQLWKSSEKNFCHGAKHHQNTSSASRITSNQNRNDQTIESIKKCTKKNRSFTFEEYNSRRRDEASRSIVVQVSSEKSCTELYNYCQDYGDVVGLHTFLTGKNMHIMVVEFESAESVDDVRAEATYLNRNQVIPTNSPIMWFRKVPIKTVPQNDKEQIKLNITRTTPMLSKKQLSDLLMSAESVSQQMALYYNTMNLTDVEVRLRYLTAYHIEDSFRSLFPNITSHVFGSSVNGFGKRGCDLDVRITLDNVIKEDDSSRLVHHTKTMGTDERTKVKKFMELFADAMNLFLPGVNNVRKILNARVPIIKFENTLTDLECDFSMTDMTAVYMSELLRLFGLIDWRVRPLVFTVREWAKVIGLTSPSIPGPWITNFSLTLLVLHYLQTRQILPTLNELKKNANKKDISITDTYVDCTFSRDISWFDKSKSSQSLENLLFGFFEFYSSFNFSQRGISLVEGRDVSKPDSSALYIQNPFERNLNVSKNVSNEEVIRLKYAVQNSLWYIETKLNKDKQLGILYFFEQGSKLLKHPKERKNMAIDVHALFKNDEVEDKAVETAR